MGTCVRVALLAVGLSLESLPARAAPPAARSVPDAPYPEEFRVRVEAEIQRGSKALHARLAKRLAEPPDGVDEHADGSRALVLLTLLKCGVPATDPVLVSGFEGLRKQVPTQVYDVGVALM